jgi:glycosyltransferase involved in cell wall biosynthesis
LRISIAVPSRDYGRYLEPCLASIAMQEHRDYEVLIADGGSSDDSVAVAERYAQRDRRFRIVSRADRGQADAVQRAFAASTGVVFGFLNADDFYLRADALALVASAFAASPETDIVSFGGHYVDEAGRHLGRVRLRRHPLDSLRRIRYRTSVLQPGTFWRRHVQEVVPLRTDLHYVFDSWFFYEAHGRFGWREFDEAIVAYRLHGSNKSTGIRPDRVGEIARFEAHKFGSTSVRARYVALLASVLARCDAMGRPGAAMKSLVYHVVNGLSFLTAYRLPGI